MTDKIIDKIPPQSVEAEESVLGSLLIDKDAMIKIADFMSENDFYMNSNKLIYRVMFDLFSRQEPIDIVSVASRLEDLGQIEKIGGKSYLTKLSNAVPTASNVVHYAQIVQKKSTLRRLLTAASEIGELGFKEEDNIDDLLDLAENKIFSVSQKFLKNTFEPITNMLNSAFDRIDDLHKQSGKLRGIPTGFDELDKLTSGLQKSDLVILAARPSVGKTSFALDVARNAAVKGKISVGVFSLEMSKEQLVDRMLCAQSGVNLWKMRTGNLSDKEEDNDFAKIAEGMGVLSDAKIFIDDSADCSITEIRTKSRRLQTEHGLDLIIVDYLQLMQGKGTYKDNRVQEVSEISRGLKGLAKELDVPVVALSQLSRMVEQTKPAIPKLSHLRESGSIEQDADIVMFLYRKSADRNYNKEDLPQDEQKSGQLIVAKHRNGPTGNVYLYFDEDTASFKNLDRSGYDDIPEF